MRVAFFLSLVAVVATTTQAFTTAPAFTKAPMTTGLSESSSHIDKAFTASSGMNDHVIPSIIDHLNHDNFQESLEMMEPLLMNECVDHEYNEYMTQLEQKCHALGKEVPSNYAPTHP